MTEQTKPSIAITPTAAKALREAQEGETDALHLEVSAGYQFSLFFGPAAPGEVEIESAGVKLLLDAESASRAGGVAIDFIEGRSGGGFKITSPNQPARVQQLTATELKAMLDAGTQIQLYDVRTAQERAIAVIAGARFFDREGQQAFEALDRNATVVFHCHHGGRSQAAAERAIYLGFKDVYNLRGGIDAWSQAVDPSVPRY